MVAALGLCFVCIFCSGLPGIGYFLVVSVRLTDMSPIHVFLVTCPASSN